jgi:hypothetical protein
MNGQGRAGPGGTRADTYKLSPLELWASMKNISSRMNDVMAVVRVPGNVTMLSHSGSCGKQSTQSARANVSCQPSPRTQQYSNHAAA